MQEVVRCARAASAPGPNGVPYRVYKGAPDVLKYLWKLMVIVWKKGTIPRMWCWAGGIFIPKKRDAVTTVPVQCTVFTSLGGVHYLLLYNTES